MKAVVTVIGKDKVGIIASISAVCHTHGINILDISQKVMSDTFAMIMMVDIEGVNTSFEQFAEALEQTGFALGVVVKTIHEDLFNTMHRI